MPVRMSVDELRPGMKLVKPFVVKGRTMLQRNSALTHDEIRKLRNRYPDLYLTVTDPASESGIMLKQPEVILNSDEAKAIEAAILQAGDELSIYLTLSQGSKARVEHCTRQAISALADFPDLCQWVHSGIRERRPLTLHNLKTFYLSMVLANKNQAYILEERQRMSSLKNMSASSAKELGSFGLGILLMDYSLHEIPQVFNPGYALSTDDKRALLLHARNAMDELPSGLPSVAKVLIKSHHENMLGRGFPNRVAADKIHVFSRIVRIADAFNAGTNCDLFKLEAKTAVEAFWEMTRGPYRFFFDPILMQSFSKIVHPMPVGSKIKLTDGRCAVVVAPNGDDALSPLVVVAYNVDGEKLANDQLQGPYILGKQIMGKSIGKLPLDFLYIDVSEDSPPQPKIDTPFDVFYP